MRLGPPPAASARDRIKEGQYKRQLIQEVCSGNSNQCPSPIRKYSDLHFVKAVTYLLKLEGRYEFELFSCRPQKDTQFLDSNGLGTNETTEESASTEVGGK